MRKVTTVNLNNTAYQIDEDGYELLRSYLDRAELALKQNPDRSEILADLEQAIGEKFRIALGPHQNVVSTTEVERILREMGPVEGTDSTSAGDGGNANAAGLGAKPEQRFTEAPNSAPRRLYRIEEGAMLFGVCRGLAAFFGVDPVLVRLGFVAALFLGGSGVLVYLILWLVVPKAETAEERAAAHGKPFNAQELIDRVKKKREDFGPSASWRTRMRQGMSKLTMPATASVGAPSYFARITAGLLLPVITIFSAAWFTACAVAFIATAWALHIGVWSFPDGSLNLPDNLPHWLVLLAIAFVYALLAIPVAAARRGALYYLNSGHSHGWANTWSGLLWVFLVGAAMWALYITVPWAQEVLRQLLQTGSVTVSV
jgi:phage shock protein PspC (stress-responsive transcriptional regulator)